MPDFTMPEYLPALPAKHFLRRHCGISLTLWRKIKQTGSVCLNGQTLLPNALVQPGQTITVTWQETVSNLPPIELPLSIAYEDEFLLVADKPKGMLVHPTTGLETDTLANAVLFYYQQQGLPWNFHPVHRLDRNTSGLVLIAKRPDIQHRLTNSISQLHRCYQAIVCGNPHPLAGCIDAPISRCADSIIKRQVFTQTQQVYTKPELQTEQSPQIPQAALTHYRTLLTFPAYSLLELILATGRTHQIRVHLAHIGHPLVGDTLYGSASPLLSRQALHAFRLEFTHPITEKQVTITSTLPADLRKLLQKLSE